MKILGSAAAALLMSTSYAVAADAVTDVPSAPTSEVVQFYDWTGAYVGVTAGYAWNKTDFRQGALKQDANVDGAFAGGYVGYNFLQSGPWVAGIEGDYVKDWADSSAPAGTLTRAVETKWSASVRGRAGYAFDRSLVYGTAGWATGKFESTSPARAAYKETLNGWTVGAGFEQAFTDNVVGRVEYRYTDFSDKTINASKVDADKHTFGAGVSWKF